MTTRTYVVTGASNGIGRCLAANLQEAGHKVIAMDVVKPSDAVEQFIKLDLNDPESVAAAVSSLPDKLDGLCNSAGLPPRDGLSAQILAVNFLGTRAFTQAVEAKLAAGASVVSLASRAGAKWPQGLDQVKRLAALRFGDDVSGFLDDEDIDPVRAYDLSKEAIIVWTMAQSESYLNQSWRINSISPGAVETRILSDFATAFGERMHKNVTRAGRAGTPQEIADLADYLLSPKSSWIKGVDVGIDGGMSAFSQSDALDLSGII